MWPHQKWNILHFQNSINSCHKRLLQLYNKLTYQLSPLPLILHTDETFIYSHHYINNVLQVGHFLRRHFKLISIMCVQIMPFLRALTHKMPQLEEEASLPHKANTRRAKRFCVSRGSVPSCTDLQQHVQRDASLK